MLDNVHHYENQLQCWSLHLRQTVSETKEPDISCSINKYFFNFTKYVALVSEKINPSNLHFEK